MRHKRYWVDKTQDEEKKNQTKKTQKKTKKHKKNPHNTTLKKKTMSITDLIKKQWYTQVIAKGKQFLILIRHSQSYVYPLKVLSMREEIIILCKWEIYIAM